jgi:hypothetical protein
MLKSSKFEKNHAKKKKKKPPHHQAVDLATVNQVSGLSVTNFKPLRAVAYAPTTVSN